MKKYLLCLALITLGSMACAQSAITNKALESISSTDLDETGWQFRLVPYLWFAGLEGEISAVSSQPPLPVDVSPGDAIKDTETSFMLMFEAKKNSHGIFADFIYTDVRSDEELVPAINLTMKSMTKTTMFTVGYEYEVYHENNAVVDLMAGGRYWKVDSTLEFGGGLGVLAGRKIKNGDSWVDPALGLKGLAMIGSSKFYVEGGAGIGGFGVGSDFYYELNGSVGYQWNKAIGTAIGYRFFNVKYDDDFVYDVKQQGWQANLSWTF